MRDCEIRTQNLSPVYEQSGVCSIYSATTQFTGGNAVGTASKLKYVHCFKSNYDAVVNGTGSSVQ